MNLYLSTWWKPEDRKKNMWILMDYKCMDHYVKHKHFIKSNGNDQWFKMCMVQCKNKNNEHRLGSKRNAHAKPNLKPQLTNRTWMNKSIYANKNKR